MRARFESSVEKAKNRAQRDPSEGNFSAGGFQSAERGRDARNWMLSNLSPDSALESDREEMIQRVDSAVKNYELACNHVEGRVIRVAGRGMTIEPEIGFAEAEDGDISAADETLNATLRTNWEILCERIGKHGEELWQIQQQMQRDYERRGEFFLLIGDRYDPLSPVTTKVELIDPDRVSTPDNMASDKSIRMGIKLDAEGCAVGCYIRTSQPGDSLDVRHKWIYEPFWLPNGMPRVLHYFDRVLRGQHRGFPRMQVGTKRLKNAEDYDEAELERNFVASCHVGVIHSDLPPDEVAEATGAVTDASGKRVSEMAPGRFFYGGMADQVEFNNPSGPTGTFVPYMEHQGRQFAAGVGTHLELLSGDWKQMSYSTARLLWNVEDATIAVIQLAHDWAVRWIYRTFVTRMILEGLVDIEISEYRSNPWPFWSARVIYPPKASIDPTREDRGELVNIESGMIPGGEMAERLNGKPASKVYAAVARDRRQRKKFGLEEHLPQMGRDQELMPEPTTGGAPTQRGDSNQKSSDANSDKQATGAAA